MTRTHILLALALAAAAVLVSCGNKREEGLIDCYDLNLDQGVPEVCKPDYMGHYSDGRIGAGADGTRRRHAYPTDGGWKVGDKESKQ